MEQLFEIIHENADLLVVNKPAGLVCHPTKGDQFSSLISRARLHLKAESLKLVASLAEPSAFSLRPFLINRLDRETSGVVLIAKNAAAAGELGKLWETRAVQKEYLALVHGHVPDDHGVVDAPLGRDEHSRVAVKDCVRPDGAPARTEFWVEQRFNRNGRAGSPLPADRSNTDDGAHGVTRPTEGHLSAITRPAPSSILHLPSSFSLLRVIPHTGRKHQIRIHLAHLGHPIVGDKLYGSDEDLYLALVENRLTLEQQARLLLPNQALHACDLRFVWRGRPVEFSCAPEPWFTDFIPAANLWAPR